MGDHLTYKVGADVIVRACSVHFVEHGVSHIVEAPCVQVQILAAVGHAAALAEHALHIPDAAGLHGNNVVGNVAQSVVVGILQYILAHPDSRPVMRDHLHNEIV